MTQHLKSFEGLKTVLQCKPESSNTHSLFSFMLSLTSQERTPITKSWYTFLAIFLSPIDVTAHEAEHDPELFKFSYKGFSSHSGHSVSGSFCLASGSVRIRACRMSDRKIIPTIYLLYLPLPDDGLQLSLFYSHGLQNFQLTNCVSQYPRNTVNGAEAPGSLWYLDYCMFFQQQG